MHDAVCPARLRSRHGPLRHAMVTACGAASFCAQQRASMHFIGMAVYDHSAQSAAGGVSTNMATQMHAGAR